MAKKYSSLLLLGSASVLAMCAIANAQEPEKVTSSASRISIQGYEQPTPVTVLDSATIGRDAKLEIGDSIRELPAVGISDSHNNGSRTFNASPGDAGMDTISLRSLGTARTLVLFDGQRIVSSNPNNGANGGGGGAIGSGGGGGVDLSTLPSTLIERVDVVTGGASAAWGSDAVAGVVNLVLNKTYEGFKGHISFGDTDKDDHRVYKMELTAGTTFAGGRGHLILSGQHTMSGDTVFASSRDWWRPQALFPQGQSPTTSFGSCGGGTAASPMCVRTYINGNAAFTQGGLVTGSTTTGGTASTLFRGIQFGANGTQAPFSFGTTFASNCTGCSATEAGGTYQYFILAEPYHNTTLFGYGSYDITDDITASVQINFGSNSAKNVANPKRFSGQIKVDNPYLDPSLAAQMTTSGIQSITVATNNVVGIPDDETRHPTWKTLDNSLGYPTDYVKRELKRAVFTLNGKFGSDWAWNAYAANSEVRERMYMNNNTLSANYLLAIDAVRVAATGANAVTPGAAAALAAAGAAIPQVGSIACRSSLTATSWGVIPGTVPGSVAIAAGGLTPTCVPLNIMGTNVASQAAIDYISPGRNNHAIADQATFIMQQSVFAGSVQGVLPFGLPAGNVAVAFGGEYRLEQQRNIRDPLQIGTIPGWGGGNFGQYAGQYNVKEGFLEVTAPILKDDFVQSLDFNAAGRFTDYSTSGQVQTWKMGMISQVNDDIRLRASWSADIRAPFISELFTSQPPGFNKATIPDPFHGNTTVNFTSTNQGNSALKPENATTISGGIVLTPHWIEGLTLSMDWYSITIKNAVFSASAGQVANQCKNGSAAACSGVLFGATTVGGAIATSETDGNGVVTTKFGNFTSDFNGALNFVLASPVNIASETTSGLDFQADYRHDLFAGQMSWRLLGNYNDQRTRTIPNNAGTALVTFNGAGAIGSEVNQPIIAGPKFHATLAATYDQGQWEATVQSRFIGTARLVNTWVEGVNVDNNGVPAVAYVDLRLIYRWTDEVNIYGAVDNTFNTPPPSIPTSAGDNAGGQNYQAQVYDGLGRSFRVGLRFAY
jgi:outer membrane receptor protein involved in Fe transport